MAKLCITRTIKLVSVIPVNRDYYPAYDDDQANMSPDEARDYELGKDFDNKIEGFVEDIESVDFDKPLHYSEVGTTADFSEQVTIIE